MNLFLCLFLFGVYPVASPVYAPPRNSLVNFQLCLSLALYTFQSSLIPCVESSIFVARAEHLSRLCCLHYIHRFSSKLNYSQVGHANLTWFTCLLLERGTLTHSLDGLDPECARALAETLCLTRASPAESNLQTRCRQDERVSERGSSLPCCKLAKWDCSHPGWFCL